MTARSCWNALVHGKWTATRLMSRKWWALNIVTAVYLVICFIIVARLRIYESTIVEAAINRLADIAIAFFGTNVLQKLIETYGNKNSEV